MSTVAELSDTPAAEGDRITPGGRLELLETSFARLRLSVLTMTPMGALMGALLHWHGGDGWVLWVWGAAYAVVALGVNMVRRRYRQDKGWQSPEAQLARWMPRMHALAIGHGVGLSLTVVLCIGHSPPQFMLLLHVTLLAILTVNAAQMPAVLSIYRCFFLGTVGIVLLSPWTFPEYSYFLVPMALVMSVVIDRSALQAHRFFVRQVALGEHSRDLAVRYRAARDAAEVALAEKNRFISTAAHDLRQPVHAIALLTEAVVLRNRDPSLAEPLSDLRHNLRAVQRMFDSLLDLSKIESGTLALRPQPVLLAPLLDDLLLQFTPEARARGLALRLRPPPTGATVRADDPLLRQSLANLVHNALRYTPQGGVLVGVRKRGAFWRIEVWDTGLGVALEDQGRIYQPFYRPEHAWSIHREGHGLGLAVVARCAHLMGAQHGLRSRLGRGSCFWLQLEATTAPNAVPASSPVPLPGALPLQGRCLVLDDDPHVLHAWSTLLASWGLQCVLASDASEAFARVDADAPPDVILCDQRLRSGESGFDILRALLAQYPDAHGALVSGEFDAPELADAEAEGYLVLKKPVDVAQLQGLLLQWLPQRATPAGRSAPAEHPG